MALTRRPSFFFARLLQGSPLGTVLRAALAAIAVVCVPSMASASAILGSAANVTGISDLIVAGVTYDIQFSTDSYNTTFASQPPTFLNDNAGATAASQAIASLFLTEGVTGINGLDCNTMPGGVTQYFHCLVLVPNALSSPNGSAARVQHVLLFDGSTIDWFGYSAGAAAFDVNDPLGLQIGPPNFLGGSGGYKVFAVFTPDLTAEVPEPATLALIGLGLVGVAAARRRKR